MNYIACPKVILKQFPHSDVKHAMIFMEVLNRWDKWVKMPKEDMGPAMTELMQHSITPQDVHYARQKVKAVKPSHQAALDHITQPEVEVEEEVIEMENNLEVSENENVTPE